MKPIVIALGLLLVSPLASAVDLTNRTVGLGVMQTLSGLGATAPQFSAKFALQPKVDLSALFGMKLGGVSAFSPGARIAFNLVTEKQMNLYAAGAFALDLRTTGGLVAFLYQVGPGIEFFFSEWPNVGFSLDVGFGGQLVSGGTSNLGLLTNATPFGGAGIHYYF